MRGMAWVTCLWPGLPQLWVRGSWIALAVALAAAGLLNWVLLVSFAWSELVEPDVRRVLWVTLGSIWVAAAGWSIVRNGKSAEREPSGSDAFKLAVEHYLKGNWFQAQRALGVLLRRDSRDVDARLMLATLLRHTGRLDEAGKQLSMLEKFEGAQKWALEIRRERRLLTQAIESVDGQTEQKATAGVSRAPAEQRHVA